MNQCSTEIISNFKWNRSTEYTDRLPPSTEKYWKRLSWLLYGTSAAVKSFQPLFSLSVAPGFSPADSCQSVRTSVIEQNFPFIPFVRSFVVKPLLEQKPSFHWHRKWLVRVPFGTYNQISSISIFSVLSWI